MNALRSLLRRPIVAVALFVALAAAGFGLGPPAGPAYAQPQPVAEAAPAKPFPQTLADWNRALDKVDLALSRDALTDTEIADLRGTVEGVRDAAQQAAADARVQSDNVRRLAEALGPAPAEGQPAEAPDIARQRQRVMGEIAGHDGRAKQCDLVITRAETMLRGISDVQRGRLTATLLRRDSAPFSLHMWRSGGVDLVGAASTIAAGPADWLASEPVREAPATAWYALLAAIVLGLTVALPIRFVLLRRLGRTHDLETAPAYSRRVLASFAEGLARGMLPAFAVGAVYLALDSFDLVFGPFGDALDGIAAAAAIFFPLVGFARASLSPDRPQWRVVPLDDESCRRLFRLLVTLAALMATSTALALVGRNLDLSVPVINVFLLVFNTALAVVLALISEERNWRPAPAEAALADGLPARPARGRTWGPAARFVVRVLAVAAPVTALFGFYNLSSFIVANLLNVGLAAAAYYVLSSTVREGVGAMIEAEHGPLVGLRRALGISDDASRLAHFWLAGIINFVLVAVLFVLLLPGFGVPPGQIVDGIRAAMAGVKIGGLTISLTDVVIAVALFIVVMSATRFLQRTLEDRILPQTRFDTGVQNSIKAATGYIGIVVAAILAISALGLDLSNLAIIAGALSVGIGFGLQNIVNNFVSGLIILAERPVKVGDWVVIGQHEGTVRRINVRATEIETFQRASVIVPNSDLLSGALVNWTHKNKLGRVDIKLGVAYGSDTELVRQTLLDCAADNPRILTWPKPQVVFRAFGASTLDFELRGFISDVEESLLVKSELHFAIEKAFRERNIEIPFGQTDVHLRDIDRLEALVERLVAGRSGEGSALTSTPAADKPDVTAGGGVPAAALRGKEGEA
jgi:small-conductance mechanosensitive channel